MLDDEKIQVSIDNHIKRNWEILKLLREKGLGLNSAFMTEHHFFAPRQLEAAKLAMALEKKNFNIVEIEPAETKEGREGWAVVGEVEMTLEAAADPATAEELIKLAATFEARYEGWGAEVE
jgi:regulator of RNase E activity RraB